MPTQVQFRRGNTTQNNSFTGAEGELSINTDNNALRVHDGSTTGGHELAKADLSNTTGIGTLSLNSLSIDSTEIISSSRQLKNITSLDTITTATIETAIQNAPNTFTDLTIVGVTTLNNTSISNLTVSGVTTSTNGFVGNLTGNASSATYAPNAGVSTYAGTAGIATYAPNAGVSTYAGTAGIATYAPNSGFSTYAGTAGIATVSEGLTGVPNINVGTVDAFDGNFAGNVNILGVLTYEDVTNVDSIGLVTARSGINVGTSISIGSTLSPNGNASFSGIVTASTFVGNLTGTATTSTNLNGQSASYYLDYDNFTNVPTNLSQFNNNVGFATETFVNTSISQSLVGYATETFVTNSLVGYATEGYVTNSLIGYATETFVTNSLIGYATEGYVDNSIVGFITSGALVGYATEGYVDNSIVGFITSGALVGYATEGYVNDRSSNWSSSTIGIHTLSNVGVGTTNPEGLFQVGTGVTINSNDISVSGFVNAAGGFISVGNTTPIQISLEGNQLIFTAVGIGSTSFTLF